MRIRMAMFQHCFECRMRLLLTSLDTLTSVMNVKHYQINSVTFKLLMVTQYITQHTTFHSAVLSHVRQIGPVRQLMRDLVQNFTLVRTPQNHCFTQTTSSAMALSISEISADEGTQEITA